MGAWTTCWDVMTLLPPVGCAEIATTRDLDNLGKELRGETGQLRGRVPATWVSPLGR
jgi:hypothetical protein